MKTLCVAAVTMHLLAIPADCFAEDRQASEHKIFSLIDEVIASPAKRPRLEPKIMAALKALFAAYEKETGEKLYFPKGSVQFGTDIVDPTSPIVLASRLIEASIIRDSLLVSRGTVRTSITQSVSIVSGQLIQSGIAGRENKEHPKYLLASGGVMDLGIVSNAVIASEVKPKATGDGLVWANTRPPRSTTLPTKAVLEVWDALSGDSTALYFLDGMDVKKKVEYGGELSGASGTVRLYFVTDDYEALLARGGAFEWQKLKIVPAATPFTVEAPKTRISRNVFDDKQLDLDLQAAKAALTAAEAEKAQLDDRIMKVFGPQYGGSRSMWMMSLGYEQLYQPHNVMAACKRWLLTIDEIDSARSKSTSEVQDRIDQLKKVITDIWTDKEKAHLRNGDTEKAAREALGALESILMAKDGAPVEVPFGESRFSVKSGP